MKESPVTRTNKVTNLLLSQEGVDLDDLFDQVQQIQGLVNGIVTTPTIDPTIPSSVNQIRDGSYSHSWASWNNTGATDNTNLEGFPWYSQPLTTGQPMSKSNSADGDSFLSFYSVDTSTDTLDFLTATHIITGTLVYFITGSLPSPLVTNTPYYAIAVSSSTIQVATTLANALAGIPINLTTTGAGGGTMQWNYTLKQALNTHYSAYFADWDWPTGTARFNNFTDISTYFSPTTLNPSYSYFAGITCVKANAYVACDENVRIAAGLYAHSTAKAGWDWVYGPFGVTADVINGTDTSTTSRDYIVHAITDRGFTVQSTVLTVATAPSDLNFASGGVVVLDWPQVLNYGITSYDIYRKTGAVYEKLVSIGTGQLEYIDNNVGTVVGGYPSYTFNELVAFTATQQGAIEALSYSGDPLVNQWATIPFAIRTPFNYDKSDTILSDSYWLRFYITGQNANGRLDFQVTDGVATNGSANITSAVAQFSTTDPNMAGLSVDVTDSLGNVLSTTISSVGSTSGIILAATWPYANATDVTVYVYGGAISHPILMDLVFLDFRAGTGFAPNSEDISPLRGIPPVRPNGSTQGGSGSGGSGGDGFPTCISFEENVETVNGIVLGKDLKKGMMLPNGYGTVNRIDEVKYALANIWRIETENGVTLHCTLSKQIFTSQKRKKALAKLNVGDKILTCIDDEIISSAIKSKIKIKDKAPVVQIGLSPDEHFLAGQNGSVVVSNNKPAAPDP